jgi:hypothetical protein
MKRYIFTSFVIALFACGSFGQTVSLDFQKVVEERLRDKDLTLATVCPIETNIVAHRVFKDYGAMFIADDVQWPTKCVFANEEEVQAFQRTLKTKSEVINGTTVVLQEEAMEALIKARKEAAKRGLKITPRGGFASKRSFTDTARIWSSRFEPGLKHWIGKRKLTFVQAEAARRLDIIAQVAQVIDWDENEWWFSTFFNRSIFSSVAAPGTSQHLSLLALDVTEFENKSVREVLNDHGWYQTIIDDTPHFTYIGRDEDDLPNHGLRAATRGGFTFWIPNFDREFRVTPRPSTQKAK